MTIPAIRGGGESVLPHRERFRASIGAVDPRLTAGVSGSQRYELVSTLGRSSVVARCDWVTAHAIRRPVLLGLMAEGLLLVPAAPRVGVVAFLEADWMPEDHDAFLRVPKETWHVVPLTISTTRPAAQAGGS